MKIEFNWNFNVKQKILLSVNHRCYLVILIKLNSVTLVLRRETFYVNTDRQKQNHDYDIKIYQNKNVFFL